MVDDMSSQAAAKYYVKEATFIDQERALIRKARSAMRERGIDVAGLDESVMLWAGARYVLYDEKGTKDPGMDGR